MRTINPAAQTSITATAEATPASRSGLSTDGKIAVGVAVPLGILAIGLGGYLLYQHGKKKGTKDHSEARNSGVASWQKEILKNDDAYQMRPFNTSPPPSQIYGEAPGDVAYDSHQPNQGRYELASNQAGQ